MKKNLLKKCTSLLLVVLLVATSMSQIACGKATTLARVGAVFVQGSLAYKAELQSLHVGGLLTDAKFAELDVQAGEIVTSAQALADYLNGLPGVTSTNKAELLQKIAEGLGLARGVFANANLVGLPANSTALKIIQIAILTLDNAAVAIAATNPPPSSTASFSTIGGGSDGSVPLSGVKVKLPAIPKDVKAALDKAAK